MGNVSVAIAEDNEKIFRILNDLEYTKLTNDGEKPDMVLVYVKKPADFDAILSGDSDSSSTKLVSEDEVQRNKSLQEKVTEIIHEVGVPAHIKGYQYLREAIIMSVEDMDMLNSITKVLYPEIAKRFKANDKQVERAIRNSIETAWIKGNHEALKEIFCEHYEKGLERPTNTEVIKVLRDKVSKEQIA